MIVIVTDRLVAIPVPGVCYRWYKIWEKNMNKEKETRVNNDVNMKWISLKKSTMSFPNLIR